MALHIMLDLSHLNTINTCSHSLGTVHKTLLGGAEEWRIVFFFSIDCSQRETYNDNDNDNDNILFDHNVQIEITIFNSLEKPNYKLVWRLLLRQINLSLS